MPVPSFLFEMTEVDLFELKGVLHVAVVDYLTKWPIVEQLDVTRLDTIVTALKVFADFEVPKQIVLDNAPKFTSIMLQSFVASYGTLLKTRSPCIW